MNEEVIVTAFSADGYQQYGKRFLESYDSPFPLMVCTSGMRTVELGDSVHHLGQEEIPELASFLDRWRDDHVVAGKKPHISTAAWKSKEVVNGYSYRFDAYKFCRMVFVMWHMAELLARHGAEKMMWLDGDSVIRRRLPDDMFDRFLSPRAAFSFLGRDAKHSETGFLIFRLPDALPVLREWVSFYTDDTFFAQPEWHSAYLFDRAREAHPEVSGHNLTPGGSGHVIHQCEVGAFIDHLKGNRKNRGRSPEAR